MKVTETSTRLDLDCLLVAQAVENKPGLPSKSAIADETGLGTARVSKCIRRINSGGASLSLDRIDYGITTAKAGPFAGQTVKGWWPMCVAVYQEVMDQADAHEASIEQGLRRSRELAHLGTSS